MGSSLSRTTMPSCPRTVGRGLRMCTEGSPAEMELRLESSTSCPPPSPKPEVAQAAGGDGVRRDLGPSSPPGGGGGRCGGGAELWQTRPGPLAALRWAWDLGGSGLLPGRLLSLSLSKPARPQGPAGAPPCPGVLPRGRGCSQSRVCLAREPCPWLHNSQNGIRPRVFLNRATKKCEFSVGSGSRPPPS